MILIELDGDFIINVQVEHMIGELETIPNLVDRETRIKGKGEIHISSTAKWSGCVVKFHSGGKVRMTF